jgi:hypothetical protein
MRFAVAGAHARNLEVQQKYDVNYQQYWFDEGTGKVFGLVEAPNSGIWRHEGWNAKPPPAGVNILWLDAALNFNGKLDVHDLGNDGLYWHAWQVDTPPFWSAWASLGSPPPGIRAADRLTTIGTNQDGRLEVFVVGQDGAV